MKIVKATVLASLLAGCMEDSGSSGEPQIKPLTIPVVVHVLYTDYPGTNISNEKVTSQIAVLNDDFALAEHHRSQIPAEFRDLAVDMELRFELAQQDPNGESTTGITRTQDTSFNSNVDQAYKFTDLGGQDAWPADQYLNIWVRESIDRHEQVKLAGMAQMPGGNPETDGVMVSFKAFGTTGALQDGLHLGKTATHEVGHWLGLYHVAGSDCTWTDYVDDTPVAIKGSNLTHPHSSCGSADMVMNFMESHRDEGLHMFTQGQKDRVWSFLLRGGERYPLYQYLTEQ